MDDRLRRDERAGPPASPEEVVEAVLRGQRTGQLGVGVCSACEGRQVLISDSGGAEDCPICFGSGCLCSRAHLDLAAFAGDKKMRGQLGHSEGSSPCWCSTEVPGLAGFLETVEEGWGFVPTVLAISSAIGAPGPSATLRLDKRSLVFVQKALDWLDERWDLLDSIFSPDDWGLAMTLLEQTWVDSAASGDTDAQLEPARTAVVAWAHQALSPEPSLRRQSTNRICTTFNTRDPVRIPHPGRPFF